MTAARTPAAEVDIDLGLVKTLIEDQFPQYAEWRLQPIGSGWDNVMFRLGDELLVRLPHRAGACWPSARALPLALEHRALAREDSAAKRCGLRVWVRGRKPEVSIAGGFFALVVGHSSATLRAFFPHRKKP